MPCNQPDVVDSTERVAKKGQLQGTRKSAALSVTLVFSKGTEICINEKSEVKSNNSPCRSKPKHTWLTRIVSQS